MSVDLKKCKRCGNIFQYLGKPYCADCLDLYEEEFHTVRDYLYEHPSANVEEISRETEIEPKTIFGFIQDGRIVMSKPVLSCKLCGQSIASGDTCEACKQKLIGKIQGSIPKKEPAKLDNKHSHDEMHVVKGKNKK